MSFGVVLAELRCASEPRLADLEVIVIVIEVEDELVATLDHHAQDGGAIERLIHGRERTRVPRRERGQQALLLERRDLGEILLLPLREPPTLAAPELVHLALAECSVRQLRDGVGVRDQPPFVARDATPGYGCDLRDAMSVVGSSLGKDANEERTRMSRTRRRQLL